MVIPFSLHMCLRARLLISAAVTGGLLTAGCTDAEETARLEPEPSASPRASNSPAKPQPALAPARSQPVEDPYYPDDGEPYLDTLHYELTLEWDPADEKLDGEARITFRVTEPRRRVRLDFGRPLKVTSARLDASDVEVTRNGDDIVVDTGSLQPGRKHELTIGYSGTPRPTAHPGGRSDLDDLGWTTESDGSVWTMQEPYGAYTWYPVNDHPSDKAYYDATISSGGNLRPVFNGKLVKSTKHGGVTTTRWHLDEPAAAYLVTIAIGDYKRVRDKGPGGLPISYWIESGDKSAVDWLRESPRMLRWLSDMLGPYPFDTFGVVVVPSLAGMETQTLVTLGGPLFREDELRVRSVLLHEYAHQWFGDSVTPDNWPDLWMNEGFATYVETLWLDEVGLQSYDQAVRQWERVDAAVRSEYGPPGAYDPEQFATTTVYWSSALMLDRLRERIGHKAMMSALRAWPRERRNTSTDRDDLVAWLEERTGQKLSGFFDRWLTSPTTPSG